MWLQTLSLRVFLAAKRVLKLNSLLTEFSSCQLQPLPLWRQLLGVMSSLASIVPRAHLRMRSLQLRLNSAGRLLADSDSVAWDSSCREDLRWWSDDAHLLVDPHLGLSQPNLSLFTDASDSGWGASLGEDHLSGSWSPHVFCFIDQPPGAPCGPLQGSGVSSSSASSVGQLVCGQHHRSGLPAESGEHSFFSPQFRGSGNPASLRVPPGSLSPSVHPGSSERHGRLPQSSFAGPQFGVDPVFSSFPGSPSPVVCGDRLVRDISQPSPSGILLANGRSSVGGHGCDDAAVEWSPLQAYAFPPFGLLQPVIAKVRQSRGLELTLVALFWPQHPWFPDILELLAAVSVFLPSWKDLLRQPHFHRFHQNLPVLRLTAFRISRIRRTCLFI